MEVRTPFAQVVISSREHSVNSAQQAKQDYKRDPDTVQVRIQIRFTTWRLPSPACQGVDRMISVGICFHDFEFRFSQSNDVQPIRSYGVPIYSGGDTAVLTGGDVWFTFRASEVASAPLRVTVSTPGALQVSATFDLAALR
jgi:hypothetical protein